jgi:hypothetical protein
MENRAVAGAYLADNRGVDSMSCGIWKNLREITVLQGAQRSSMLEVLEDF